VTVSRESSTQFREDALREETPVRALVNHEAWATDILEAIRSSDSVLTALPAELPVYVLLAYCTACDRVQKFLESSSSAPDIVAAVYGSYASKHLRALL
jgi:hypothetical protein